MAKVRVTFGEQSTTTTGGVAYVPFPFPGPIIMKNQGVDSGAVKARESCLRAMRAFTDGKIDRKELDRICGGMKR